jgi:hypothetical protein
MTRERAASSYSGEVQSRSDVGVLATDTGYLKVCTAGIILQGVSTHDCPSVPWRSRIGAVAQHVGLGKRESFRCVIAGRAGLAVDHHQTTDTTLVQLAVPPQVL